MTLVVVHIYLISIVTYFSLFIVENICKETLKVKLRICTQLAVDTASSKSDSF